MSSVLAGVLLTGGVLGGCGASEDDEDSDLCVAIRAARDELLREPLGGGGSRAVLVVGDSYTQATGLGGPAHAWPATLAEPAAATVTVDGMSSTGFTTAGFCPGEPFTYADRLAGHDVADDTTVIIQGGVNDGLSGDPGELGSSADAALDEAGGAARIVVVGPPAIPALDAGVLGTIDRTLAAAAQEHDAVYVSLLAEDIPIGEDDVHPTAAGQERMAQVIAAALG